MNKFIANKLVKECIENNDIDGLKGAFVGIIFSDRSFSKGYFDNTVNYIVSMPIESKLYDKFNEKELLSNTIKNRRFTDDDFEAAVYKLEENFCQERINDVKKISKGIYGIVSTEVNKKESTFIAAKDGNNPIKKQISHQGEVNQKEENNSIKIVVGIAVVAAIAVAIAMKAMK